MALSNIFREPRRELTEQGFGLLPFAAFGLCDYGLASWFQHMAHGTNADAPLILWLLLATMALILGSIVAFGASLLMHALGEEICDAMARHGFDPRPKNRR